MKKYLIVLIITLTAFSNTLVVANVKAYLTFATFNTPDKGQYIETYLSVIGNSVKFVKNSNGKFQGAVDISISFVFNDQIKNAQKYTLNSPETADTTNGFPNFLDQHRFTLPNGSYTMELSIADKNRGEEKPFKTIVPVTINFTDDKVMLSDIQLLESYTKSTAQNVLTKSGYDMVPYVSTFYPENSSRIKFYSEIYNSKKIMGEGQKMLVSYFLESFETKTKLNDYSAFSKQTANDVNIILAEFNIEALPTGNYNLVIEVKDKDNKIQAEQRCFVQRKNKQAAMSFDDLKSIDVSTTFVTNYKNIDTLAGYIRCLRPISGFSEVQFSENQLKNKDLKMMQQYFYNFWKSRSAIDPQLAWLDYFKEVQKVNKEFGTYGLRGYDTDRGRVYLQYGAPSARTRVDTEPSAYPYEIWQYDALIDKQQDMTNPRNRQSNKKFVFYDPDLVTNNYRLIHSDARGEIYDSRWEMVIHNRDTQSHNMDDETVPDHYGGNVDDNFKNPR
jgi:GWxTD domain-containing protein